MPANLLYREAPERAAQKAQDGVDASDKNAKVLSKLVSHFIFNSCYLNKLNIFDLILINNQYYSRKKIISQI